MQNPIVVNTANSSGAANGTTAKQTPPAIVAAPFTQFLSREIADRARPATPSLTATPAPSRQAQQPKAEKPAGAPPPPAANNNNQAQAANASQNNANAANENQSADKSGADAGDKTVAVKSGDGAETKADAKTDAAEDDGKASDAAAAGAVPVDLLALVASFNQPALKPQTEAVDAGADAGLAVDATGAAGLPETVAVDAGAAQTAVPAAALDAAKAGVADTLGDAAAAQDVDVAADPLAAARAAAAAKPASADPLAANKTAARPADGAEALAAAQAALADAKTAAKDTVVKDTAAPAAAPSTDIDAAVTTASSKGSADLAAPSTANTALDTADGAARKAAQPTVANTPVAATPTETAGQDKLVAAPEVAAKAVPTPADLTAVAAPNTVPVPAASFQMAQAANVQASEKLTPAVGSPGWDQALGQKVVWMVAGGQQSATLTLNPPDLGPLQVVVNVSNDQASATFSSNQPEVRAAIEAAMPKLRDMMNDAGIQLGSSTVGTNLPNSQQQSAPGEQRQPQSARFDSAPATNALPLDIPAVRAARTASAAALGLVDTFA